jgi:hypothetical protein
MLSACRFARTASGKPATASSQETSAGSRHVYAFLAGRKIWLRFSSMGIVSPHKTTAIRFIDWKQSDAAAIMTSMFDFCNALSSPHGNDARMRLIAGGMQMRVSNPPHPDPRLRPPLLRRVPSGRFPHT